MAAKSRKRSTPAAGSKILLTTLAFLGTLGGWAYLAAEGAEEQTPSPTPQAFALDLPPIPTLVPEIDLEDQDQPEPTPEPIATPALRQVNQPASVGSSGGGGGAAGRTRSSR